MIVEKELKAIPLPAIYKREGKECYYDTYRKKLIEITPEETVRQRVAAILRKRMRCSKRDDIFGSTYVILCKGCCWKSRYNRSCLRFRK